MAGNYAELRRLEVLAGTSPDDRHDDPRRRDLGLLEKRVMNVISRTNEHERRAKREAKLRAREQRRLARRAGAAIGGPGHRPPSADVSERVCGARVRRRSTFQAEVVR